MKKIFFVLTIVFGQFMNAQIQIGDNINGEASLDLIGTATAISDDGSIIAVGGSRNDTNGTDSGFAKVYSNVNNQWVQLGSTIFGNTGDYFGRSVSLSSDGTILAVSANLSNKYVKIFEFDGNDWIQIGGDIIELSDEGYYSPSSISLSSNGMRIAIGDASNSDNGYGTGQVVIYEYNGTDWEYLGQPINGVASDLTIDERFGASVSLSADGNRVGVGAPGTGLAEGKVRVYEYDGSDWIKMGYDFGPANQGGKTGASVSLSANGNRIAVSLPGLSSGNSAVYDYNGSQWEINDYFYMGGSKISLSADGNRLAVSNPMFDWTGDGWFTGAYGVVQIYSFDDLIDDWSQLGSGIIGENAWDEFGTGVSLSADGNTVIAGAIKNDANGLDAQGHVRVFNMSFNTILSTVSFDSNDSGCTTSPVLANNVKVEIVNTEGNTVSFTNAEGISKALVQNGTFTVYPVLNNSNFTVSPLSEEIEFANLAETRTVNFCMSSNVTINDVSIVMNPLSMPRPGFESTYRITYENLGTTVVNGDVSIQFNDALQEYIEGTITPDIESTNMVSYNYTNLQPFESRNIDVILKTKEPPIVNSGDEITLISQISIIGLDDNSVNNEFILNEIAVNSFDPNDKQVLEGDEITIEEVDDYLHYVVRFQNTGTASAINVRIRDVLSDKLDWDTFLPITSSHVNYVQINNGNSVDFIFENILLPAEQNDEPNSHGFVVFKIKPKADVQIGDIVTGNAKIYFDYNLPIVTNTTSTEIVNSILSIDENIFEDYFEIYPNPASEKLYVSSKFGVTIEKIVLYSITGKLLLENTEPTNTININHLQKGVYFLNIVSERGSVTKKVLIE